MQGASFGLAPPLAATAVSRPALAAAAEKAGSRSFLAAAVVRPSRCPRGRRRAALNPLTNTTFNMKPTNRRGGRGLMFSSTIISIYRWFRLSKNTSYLKLNHLMIPPC
jgi:hypothetical protein